VGGGGGGGVGGGGRSFGFRETGSFAAAGGKFSNRSLAGHIRSGAPQKWRTQLSSSLAGKTFHCGTAAAVIAWPRYRGGLLPHQKS